MSEKRVGIAYMLLGCFLFSMIKALLKGTVNRFDPTQVLFLQNLFAILPGISFALFSSGKESLFRSKMVHWHFLRALVGVTGVYSTLRGLQVLPLTEVMPLSFSSILFSFLVSRFFLKEPISLHHWIALGLGATGIFLIADPFEFQVNEGVLFVILGAFMDAVVIVSGRWMVQREREVTTTLFYVFFCGLIAICFATRKWIPMQADDWLLFLLTGSASGLASIVMNSAFKRATTATLSPLTLSSMVWGVLFGYFLWHEIPTRIVVLGSAFLLMSCYWIIHQRT